MMCVIRDIHSTWASFFLHILNCKVATFLSQALDLISHYAALKKVSLLLIRFSDNFITYLVICVDIITIKACLTICFIKISSFLDHLLQAPQVQAAGALLQVNILFQSYLSY